MYLQTLFQEVNCSITFTTEEEKLLVRLLTVSKLFLSCKELNCELFLEKYYLYNRMDYIVLIIDFSSIR